MHSPSHYADQITAIENYRSDLKEIVIAAMTVALLGIQFADEDELERFQEAARSATTFYGGLTDPESVLDLIIVSGDSILRTHGFDPVLWSESLWATVSAARMLIREEISPASGNA